jgi:hypothetical protein
MKPPARPHIYNVTVLGETATLEGPDDIVSMYLATRRAYAPALSIELRSIDADLRLHHADHVEKVNSYEGHH